MFGRRKAPRPGDPTRVLVHEDALGDDAALIDSVVFFVDAMQREAHLRLAEIPDRALRAAYVDWWLTEVAAGGHSRFTALNDENADVVLDCVEIALGEIGAGAHGAIFAEYRQWLRTNPTKAMAQTGFGQGRAPALDEIDARLGALEAESPLVPQAAAWVRGWDGLRAVAAGRYATEVEALARANPHYAVRRRAAEAEALHRWTASAEHVAFALAARACDAAEAVLSIRPDHPGVLNGQEVEVWRVETDAGHRQGVTTGEFAALWPEGAPLAATPLAIVDAGQAAAMVRHAEHMTAGAALHLLLDRAKLATEAVTVSGLAVDPAEGRSSWLVRTRSADAVLSLTPEGIALFEGDEDGPLLATATRDEVETHAEALAA